MHEILLDQSHKPVVEEARNLAKWVSADLLRAMERGEVQYPKTFVEEAAKRNLLGLRFPKELGGRGLPFVVEMACIEEIGVLGTSLGCLYSLPSIVGEAISTFGTDDQKRRFLVPTLQGKKFCAEALTEPRGGSDFFGATTRAERKGDYFVLNGLKRFIVGAMGADYFLVYARTGDGPKEITAFLVERDETVVVERIYNLLGTRGGGTGRLRFKETMVPVENVVLGVGRGAEVFNVMMVPERLTPAAGAVAMGRAAIALAARYSTRRRAFGKSIRSFQAVSFKIADAISALDSASSLVFTAAKACDQYGSFGAGRHDETPVRRLVSEAKKVATESAWFAINQAMQVMGGIAYTDIYPIERYLRDARLSMIWTGTNEIMNLLIQHEYYAELERHYSRLRDIEHDATTTDAEDDKVFE
jgi:alkylation response protein AidB-like acyl-CoA dehydrogenase